MPKKNGQSARGIPDPPSATANPRRRARLVAHVGRQVDDIYLQLDTQLTRLAQIQLQFDQLRTRIKHL